MQYTEIEKKTYVCFFWFWKSIYFFLSLAFIWKLPKYLKFGKSIIKWARFMFLHLIRYPIRQVYCAPCHFKNMLKKWIYLFSTGKLLFHRFYNPNRHKINKRMFWRELYFCAACFLQENYLNHWRLFKKYMHFTLDLIS